MRKLPVIMAMVLVLVGVLVSSAGAQANGTIMPPGLDSGMSLRGADLRPW